MACGLGDIDDGDVAQLLQALTAVFAEAGLHHRVVLPFVTGDAVHDADSSEVALEVALDRFRTEGRRKTDDFGPGRSNRAGGRGDRVGHARGGVDIDDEDFHEPLSSDHRFTFPYCGLLFPIYDSVTATTPAVKKIDPKE